MEPFTGTDALTRLYLSTVHSDNISRFFAPAAMGWLKLGDRSTSPSSTCDKHVETKSSEAHKKHDRSPKSESEAVADNSQGLRERYPTQPVTLPDNSLPFLSSDLVRASKHAADVNWVVIDDIIYDCSEYLDNHPGGSTVIKSFQGENCSWQFWRFHNPAIMLQRGRPLRIGRTKDIANRFKEQSRFVGLRKHGVDEDDW